MLIIKPDGLRFALTFFLQRVFMLPMVWLIFRVFNQVKIEGLENLDAVEGESVILAPNHVSAWDSFVGTTWALSSRKRLVERTSYLGVLAAPENIPTPMLRVVATGLGGIPVDRDQGVEQHALLDTVRIMNETDKSVVLTVYPEGTRSKTGKLRRRGRPGIGWIQHQTGVAIIPIHHTGARAMPCLGKKMTIRIGKPIRFDHYAGAPDTVTTWRAITEEVMDELRIMEREANGEVPRNPPPPTGPHRSRRWRRASSRRNAPAWV
jgi:1-acyl-sn-glycerol-3-phosphate acyltransferase